MAQSSHPHALCFMRVYTRMGKTMREKVTRMMMVAATLGALSSKTTIFDSCNPQIPDTQTRLYAVAPDSRDLNACNERECCLLREEKDGSRDSGKKPCRWRVDVQTKSGVFELEC